MDSGPNSELIIWNNERKPYDKKKEKEWGERDRIQINVRCAEKERANDQQERRVCQGGTKKQTGFGDEMKEIR